MKPVILFVVGLGVIAGCDGGGSSGQSPRSPVPPQGTNFTSFVKDQIAATSETTSPTDVSSVTFTFPDDTNDTAFNSILPP